MSALNTIIGGAFGLGGSLLSGIGAGRVAKIQRKGQMDLAQYAYEKDLEMWRRQNAYNSPEEQMKRLDAAGLNPNLVYGSGSVVGNTSGSTPQFRAPSDYPAANVFEKIGPALNMLAAFQDFQIKGAQVDNLKAQNELIRNKAITEALNPQLMNENINLRRKQAGLAFAQTALTDENSYKLQREAVAEEEYGRRYGSGDNTGSALFQLEMKRALLRNSQLDQLLKDSRNQEILSVKELNERRSRNVDVDTALKSLEKSYQEMGVNKSDPIYFRVFSRLLKLAFPNLQF